MGDRALRDDRVNPSNDENGLMIKVPHLSYLAVSLTHTYDGNKNNSMYKGIFSSFSKIYTADIDLCVT